LQFLRSERKALPVVASELIEETSNPYDFNISKPINIASRGATEGQTSLTTNSRERYVSPGLVSLRKTSDK